MANEMMQKIFLKLSDGRWISAIVPAFTYENDPPVKVVEMKVFPPEPLMTGCHFEELPNAIKA